MGELYKSSINGRATMRQFGRRPKTYTKPKYRSGIEFKSKQLFISISNISVYIISTTITIIYLTAIVFISVDDIGISEAASFIRDIFGPLRGSIIDFID